MHLRHLNPLPPSLDKIFSGFHHVFVVEMNDALFGEHRQRHFDHADRTLHNLAAGADDCLSLLATQHGLCNFWGIGQVGQACVIDGNSSDRETLRQIVTKFACHFFGVSAKGQLTR